MDEDVQVHMGNYVFTQKYCIGQGSFGKVYRGRNKTTNRQVAIKEMDGSLITQQQIGMEISILKQMKHPNIVEYEDAFQNNGYFYIVTEYCKGGDLRNYIQELEDEDYQIRCSKILEMFWQVCEGFNYLKQFNIIHRDLKPSNILLHNGVYKIGDFGLAKKQDIHKSKIHHDLVGVPIYMAPQILSKNYYTFKCDVWSLGVMIFEMLFEQLPWKSQDIESLFFQIMNNPYPYKQMKQKIKPIFLNILETTLRYLEKDRLSWQELLQLKVGKNNISEIKSKTLIKQKSSVNSEELFILEKSHKSIEKEQTEILKHMYGLAKNLESEILVMVKEQYLITFYSTLKRYLSEGAQIKTMFLDCSFIFLSLLSSKLHIQLMEYEQLEDARMLLIFLELIHDYVKQNHSYGTFSPKMSGSLRGQIISEYAASVISKVNTFLLYNDSEILL